jgi:hypothetical protein
MTSTCIGKVQRRSVSRIMEHCDIPHTSRPIAQLSEFSEGIFGQGVFAVLRYGTQVEKAEELEALKDIWESFIADFTAPIAPVKLGLVRIDGELNYREDFLRTPEGVASLRVNNRFYPLASNPSALLACAKALNEILSILAERRLKPSFAEVSNLGLTGFTKCLGLALKGREGILGRVLARNGALKPKGIGLELIPDFSDATTLNPNYALIELP